jgi:maltose O-acetyltransferase
MLASELYLASDPELVAERLRAQELLFRFNNAPPDAADERRRLLGELLGRIGNDTVIMPSFRCDYGYNISIGERTFINYDCVILDCNRVVIGNDVQIAPRVQIYTATHPIDAVARRAGPEYALPISIGDGAWLGGGVILCPGVSIGANTVVGAGSVVTRDLPSDVVAAGNPCRVLRICGPSQRTAETVTLRR